MIKSQATSFNNFGSFFRSKRINLGFTLRSFCKKFSFDPGNISKLERGLLSPTIDQEKLEGYALALKIPKDSPDWVTFFDLAHTAKGSIPFDLKNEPEVISFLPAFFRTVRGKKLDKEKVQKLLKLLNNRD